MRLIDADELKDSFLTAYRSPFEISKNCMADRSVLRLIDNAPTVEFPEQITIKCDTEEDKQKLLSAFKNANLKVLIEEERQQDEEIGYRQGYECGYAQGYIDGQTGADYDSRECELY